MKNPITVIKNRIKFRRESVKTLRDLGMDRSIIRDFFYCKNRYRCNMDEYLRLKFYNYKDRYRKNFILSAHRPLFVNINTGAFALSKYVFYEYIPDLFKREMILAPYCGEDAFVEFLKKHQKIIVKPDMGSLGEGVQMLKYQSDEAAREFFRSIGKEEYTICEEVIRQHPEMSKMNPYSVNTLRISSLLVDGEVEILTATLRCGSRADSVTDNLSTGGIGAQVDIKTGLVCSFGKDFEGNSYSHHPTSGVQILGFQIPHWDQAIAVLKEAHKRVPQCTLYGWDIAITPDGVDIVEANSKPGIKNMQMSDGIPKGEILLPLLKQDLLKDKRRAYREEWIQKVSKYLDIESIAKNKDKD